MCECLLALLVIEVEVGLSWAWLSGKKKDGRFHIDGEEAGVRESVVVFDGL